MSQEAHPGPSGSTGSCLQYIQRKGGIVLLRAGYQFLRKRQNKSGAVVWECHLRRKNKCSGTLTIKNEQRYSGIPTDESQRSHEKPWQRVFQEITRKGVHLYEPVKSVPSSFILVLLGVYLLLGYACQLVEDDLPSVVPEASIARDDWQTFSEESALRYLHTILGGQPRVAGTKFHLQKTSDLVEMLKGIASQATLPVQVDWQFVSGDFRIGFSTPFANYYQNASNVIAVLEGESGFNPDGSTRSSLLINCHYDSVPFAEGASDNGVFCAAMAETLNRLSRRSDKFKHNIIFLFNGAEENPLQASHGFLQHPWARGVTAVVNLDSAGMNGKPSVFQVTDPRILVSYQRSTLRPSAQGVGEFLFMTGIIPSDTDFRIFRDFGGIQGIDIAFTKWGHVYHTRNDRSARLLPGVAQNAGDMLLGLAAAAADRDDLRDKITARSVVYFDYLNSFLIAFSYKVSHALDVLVGLFALLTVLYYIWLVGSRASTVQELLWSLLGRVCSLVTGVVVVAILTPIMVATTVQLRYLTQPWIVVPMFWIPFLVGTIAVAHLFDAWRTKKSGLNRSIRTLQAMAATRLVLAVVLLVMAMIPQATSVRYIVAAPLCNMALAAMVSLTAVRYFRMQAWQHLILEVVMSIPSVMFTLSIALRLDAMMLPTMGRAAGNYPDYTVAFINVGMAVLTCVSASGTELLFSRRRLWLPLGLVMAACLVFMFVPYSPYEDEGVSTQRHYWFHSEIVSYNENKEPISRSSGVLVTKHDPYTTRHVREVLSKKNMRINMRDDFREDCEKKVYCDLPLYRVAFGRYLPEALFLYTEPPAPFEPAPDVSLVNKSCVADNCTYEFEVTVLPHNLITIAPDVRVHVSNWSLQAPAARSLQAAGRAVYVVVHSAASYSDTLAPLRFSLNLRVPTSLQDQPVLELSHHAHLIAHPEAFTPEYSALLAAMPAYFNIASFLSVRSNYIF